MFLEYYNLLEQPFGVTPDTRFLYLNHMYRETLASLWYGIKEGRGFMALVAEPGDGKNHTRCFNCCNASAQRRRGRYSYSKRAVIPPI